jgi:hypothetical protein
VQTIADVFAKPIDQDYAIDSDRNISLHSMIEFRQNTPTVLVSNQQVPEVNGHSQYLLYPHSFSIDKAANLNQMLILDFHCPDHHNRVQI